MTPLWLALYVLGAAPEWKVKVRPQVARSVLHVEESFSEVPELRVCLDMPNAGSAVRRLEQRLGTAWVAQTRAKDDQDCFELTKAPRIELKYDVDLSDFEGDADYSARFGDDWVFNEEAVFFRPDPLPGGKTIDVEFELEPGQSVAAPWKTLGPGHFESSCVQYDAGSYVALGHLESLGTLQIGGARIDLTRLSGSSKPDADVLRGWVSRVFEALTTFYGEVPSGPGHRVHLVFAPIQGAKNAGVFGEVLRHGTPSVLLLYGAEATGGFVGDWVASHELFHLGNPVVQGKLPWLVEGFTTYYTDVLRARTGRLRQDEAWHSLASMCLEHGQPERGRSLGEASRGMRQAHSWDRVYQGGACLALRLDVAIRLRSQGKRSLDEVMRDLRATDAAMEESEVLARLDAESGGVASPHLGATGRLPLDTLLKALGVAVKGDEVRFDDKAPQASIRRAITGAAPP